jgi:hypothetical protein
MAIIRSLSVKFICKNDFTELNSICHLKTYKQTFYVSMKFYSELLNFKFLSNFKAQIKHPGLQFQLVGKIIINSGTVITFWQLPHCNAVVAMSYEHVRSPVSHVGEC